VQDVVALLDEGVYDMARLAEGGWVDGLRWARHAGGLAHVDVQAQLEWRASSAPGQAGTCTRHTTHVPGRCIAGPCPCGDWLCNGLCCRYEDEVLADVKKRTGRQEKEQVCAGGAAVNRQADEQPCNQELLLILHSGASAASSAHLLLPLLQLRRVSIRKYAACNRSTFGLHGKKVIAVLRASGAILGTWQRRAALRQARAACWAAEGARSKAFAC